MRRVTGICVSPCASQLSRRRGIEGDRNCVNGENQTRAHIESWIGVGAVALLALGCVLILLPFISAVLWAAIMCFTTWPLFSRLKAALGNRRTVAALLATLALAAIIVAPVAILVSRLSGNIDEIIAATQKLIHEGPPPPPSGVASIPTVGGRFASWWTLMSESSSARLAQIAEWLPAARRIVLGSGRALLAGVFQIILSLLMVFVAFSRRRRHCEAAQRHDQSNRRRARKSPAGGRGHHDARRRLRRPRDRAPAGHPGGRRLPRSRAYPAPRCWASLLSSSRWFPADRCSYRPPAIFWLYRRGLIGVGNFHADLGRCRGQPGPHREAVSDQPERRRHDAAHSHSPRACSGGAMAFGLIGLFLGPTMLAVGYSLFDEWSSSKLASRRFSLRETTAKRSARWRRALRPPPAFARSFAATGSCASALPGPHSRAVRNIRGPSSR